MRNKEPTVSVMGFSMDNSFEPGKFLVVDCGYARHPRARQNANRLLRAIGIKKWSRSYVEIVGYGRLLVRIPWKKQAVLKRFLRIHAGYGYVSTTHTYDKTGPQFDLKYHG